VDAGPIILQKSIDVLPNDTPESLQRRVMKNCEWIIYPEAIRIVCEKIRDNEI
jgi:phosphoribosylglycinamide formyltransferase-1